MAPSVGADAAFVRYPRRMSEPADLALSAALEALARGDSAAALTASIAAWRELRDPSLADAIERLSTLAAEEVTPLPTRAARNETLWLARAGNDDPRELGRLLPVVAQTTVANARRRLDALVARTPDPRIAAAMVEQLEGLPFTATGGRYYTAVHQLLRACADPRSVDRLAVLVGGFADRLGGTSTVQVHERQLAQTLQRIRDELGAWPPIAATAAAAIARLVAAIDERVSQVETGPGLLARVYAEPDLLLHRQVYADWLLARGDERGEFIALQLAADPGGGGGALDRDALTRMRWLEREHGRAWQGPLDWVLVHDDVRFERGFPVAGRVSAHARAPASLAGVPEWATFEALAGAPLEVLTHPVMRALREIDAAHEVAAALLDVDPPMARIEALVARYGRFDQAGWFAADRALRRLPGLPGLRSFGLWFEFPIEWTAAAWLWTGPMPRPITAVELGLDPESRVDLDDLAASITHPRVAREQITVHHGRLRLQFRQDDGDWQLEAAGPRAILTAANESWAALRRRGIDVILSR